MSRTKSASQPDLSEFFKLSRPKKRPCQVKFIKEQLSDAEAAQLQAACEQDKGIINAGAIREWCKDREHDVTIPAITNHRSGVCTCDA